MTAAARPNRLRPGGYQRVPEWELEQRQGQHQSQIPRQQRYQDTSAGPSNQNTGRQLPEKPLPALPPPSTPMLMSPGPGTTVGLAGRRRPAMVFWCALAGCLLAGLVLELAWHGTRAPPLGRFAECLNGGGGNKTSADVPQHFQTSPQLWAGPTATGPAPFLAQTRVVPTGSFVPNSPLQTAMPIQGMATQDEGLFKLMGYLAPYEPSPGFGVDEYGLPEGAEIVQLQMLSRHGSRYPTLNSSVTSLGDRLKAAAGKVKAKGALEFLNRWTYELGHEILVPKGRSELFESGVLHSYMYSQLYNANSKIIVRTTTQDRMLKSAEYFLAGFFGLEWHGSRYPTLNSGVTGLGDRLKAVAGKLKAKGALEFLNRWTYELGHEILVPKGRSELFESGVLHSYMYSQLYNTNSKIIVRTTTQDRMLKSAEYFLAGFFGLEWTNNATIEVIIEQGGFNNSLAGYLNCPNAWKHQVGTEASLDWQSRYLANATTRLQGLIEGYDWTIEDTYAAQTMCPYETVAYGYSRWCELFTYEEWLGFSYSVDLAFSGNNMFHNPTGRAVGLGYQQEVIARLKNHTLGYSGSQINTTLDSSEETFPLNQSLYLDFSHDTNIASILTAFGLTQFAGPLPRDKLPETHNLTVSHLTPFAARLDIEIIRAPKPVKADRSGYADKGGETKYVHFVLNQRTVPLGVSFEECDVGRVDGWCEFETFLEVQDKMEKLADFDRACFGEVPQRPFGEVNDGRPI
ncbi:3-phytase A like protein [Verticillium longisporum]|nr:3-phytase A like protein [Verticillium longisporum]